MPWYTYRCRHGPVNNSDYWPSGWGRYDCVLNSSSSLPSKGKPYLVSNKQKKAVQMTKTCVTRFGPNLVVDVETSCRLSYDFNQSDSGNSTLMTGTGHWQLFTRALETWALHASNLNAISQVSHVYRSGRNNSSINTCNIICPVTIHMLGHRSPSENFPRISLANQLCRTRP